ncbi:MAG: TerC/Alx family metal homeostasis membrane protein [Solirubrobacterales bacterium]|jgi:tellurite resistance protein TerC|nr:TerC/Alx family metal homeostasis membrane protein [Solirubrobacterales bacterium]
MLDVTTTAWLVTCGVVLALFAIDLGYAVARPHAVGFREAALASTFYIAIAVAFGIVFGTIAGWEFGGEYFAGYILEKSLSVDNLFVFVVIMTTFAVPQEHQQKVLLIGIFAALLLRVVFIMLGATLLETFSIMFLLFGLLLIFTAIQLFRHREEDPSVEDNVVVSVARKHLPVTDEYHEGKLTTRIDGKRFFTPLFLVLLAIGSVDILFALDSIPAIFGITDEVFIVFAANAFALLGLRALFFLVTGLLDRLVYLSTGLAIVLAFIGLKLGLHWGHLQNDAVPEISTTFSLAVIGVVLTITTIASLIKSKRDPSVKAHAGSLRGHPPKDSSEG